MISLCLFFLPLTASVPLLGWVESPGYPRGYPEDSSLKWRRCAPVGHVLSLTLTHLNLEDSEGCVNDALEISVDNETAFSLCGRMSYEELQSSVNPSLVSSMSGCLSLSFHSDYSNSERHSGFRAFYTVRDVDECADVEHGCTQFCSNYIGGYRCSCRPGYLLQTDAQTCRAMCSEDRSGSHQGKLSSPGWPGPYPEDAQCSYTLSVEDNLQLVLDFTEHFDVEEASDGSCVDSLLIKTPSQDFGPFCGLVPPASPLHTGSHQVQIVFSTDSSGRNTGFRLIYTTTEKTCPTQVTPNSYLTPNFPRYRQGEQVKVRCNTGFILHDARERNVIDDYTYISSCGISGVWSPAYSCEAVDCGEPNINNGPLQLASQTSSHYEGVAHFKCSSKYYLLQGDEKYTCDQHGEWRSEAGLTNFPKCVPVCGRTDKEIVSISRILGGQQADHGQIPWQLRIVSHKAGASLINDQWAITAAHVIDQQRQRPLRIYGGAVGLRDILRGEKRKTQDLIELEVEKFYIHPKYQADQKDEERLSYDNDIALIKLKSRVNLSPTLLPVCLPEKTHVGTMQGQWGTISGWGAIANSTLKQSLDLLYANVEIYPDKKCNQTPLHQIKKLPMKFTDNMFCAGNVGTDSCQGDSGGPLVIPPLGSGDSNTRNPYQIYGLVSWGPGCENLGYYTKVDKYLDWIKETIEKDP